ncbi:MAG: hypothetical protein IPM29_02310 [Planctomycetes bacterium]|nr:hypothetical protein [Planctomycetota bacterium]
MVSNQKEVAMITRANLGARIASASRLVLRSAVGFAGALAHARKFAAARLIATVLVANLGALLPSQATWQMRIWGGRHGHALAYDSARDRIVLFGGIADELNFVYLSDTWEWDGNTWTERTPAVSPPARVDHALAYDSARGRIVLFGGQGGSGRLSDTWEWDGTTWTQRTPTASPPARSGHALAYDSARSRIVLFGGFAGQPSRLFDTWEWDGSTWTQRTPAASPPGRNGHALAYDSARSRTVLFGGFDYYSTSGTFSDTWEWDGSTWTQRTRAASPPARSGHALAYDPIHRETVLFGGWARGTSFGDTWAFDGTTWTRRTPVASPPAREYHALAYDSARGRTLLFGGVGPASSLSDTWEWDGNNWTERTPAASPPARGNHALAYDSARGRTVLFGGRKSQGFFSDTWEWDGNNWTLRTPVASPPARGDHALAYDSARGRTVLFGGRIGQGLLSDTWEWDGTTWTLRTPAANPPARAYHALAYDSAHGTTVLFGGWDGQAGLSDTWEWDGTTWTLRTPAASPPARAEHALAYDDARSRTVLFGGTDTGSRLFNDTWEWDGNTWTLRTPAASPPPRVLHALAHDTARGRTVMFGGLVSFGASTSFTDTWEWDGNTWMLRTPAASPPGKNGHALAFDSARGTTVLFGGFSSDTWEYAPVSPASYVTFGNGCRGSSGTPALAAVPGRLPWIADNFAIQLTNIPSNAAAFALLGWSRTSWPPVTLPFPLDALGMTGCTLFVSGNMNLRVPTAGNTGTLTLPIPNNPLLVGAPFYNQAFVLDPVVNPAGITVSNAGEARIGAR